MTASDQAADSTAPRARLEQWAAGAPISVGADARRNDEGVAKNWLRRLFGRGASIPEPSATALWRDVSLLADETHFGTFFRRAAEFILRSLDADFAAVIVQEPDGTLTIRSCHGLASRVTESLLEQRFPAGSLVAAQALKEGTVLFIQDYRGHPKRHPQFARIGVKASLYLPVAVSASQRRAVVAVGWRRRVRSISAARFSPVEAVGGLIAAALYREGLEIERDKLVRLYAVLGHVNQAIVRSRSPESLYQEVCDIAVRDGEMRFAWIGEIGTHDGRLKRVAFAGFDEDYTEDQRPGIDPQDSALPGSLCAEAIHTGELQVVQDIEAAAGRESWRTSAARRGFRSGACIPIVVNDAVVAVFAVYAPRPGSFGESERQLLREIGNDLSHAMETMRESRQLTHTRTQLAWEATHDSLTGLPNRALLMDHLRRAIARADRSPGRKVALLMMDLDGFKEINDRLGHIGGDKLLAKVARRLQSHLNLVDTMSRFGGDEFVLLLDNVRGSGDVEAALDSVAEALRHPVEMDYEQIEVSVSTGIAIYPFDDETELIGACASDTLLSRADMAMYEAKSAGPGSHKLFDLRLDKAMRDCHVLRTRVGRALASGELAVHYQPKVDMSTGEILGVEALVRFLDERGEPQAPGAYLDAIASTRLMSAVDQWVLDSAFAQAVEWVAADEPLRVSVNVSRHYLRLPDCVDRLRRLLERYPSVKGLIQLEVLESVDTQDLNVLLPVLRDISALGMSLALDDFGTGASSLVHLQKVPASVIKIDQGFVRTLPEQPENEAIIEAIVAFAKRVPRRVVAEGVETVELGARLRELGCRYGQGYAIAKPMPPDDLARWKRDWRVPSEWRSTDCDH